MSLTLYGLKNCDTCKKALKALEAAGRPAEFVDIRTEADLSILLPTWLSQAGPDVLINRRSTTWRNLTDGERSGDAQALLMAHPTLIKRPVIEAAGEVYIGWAKNVQASLIS